MSHPTLATVLEPTPAPLDDWNPRPFKPWWRFLFVALGVIALGLFAVLLALAIPGCEKERPIDRVELDAAHAIDPATAFDRAVSTAIARVNGEVSSGDTFTWFAPPIAKRVAAAFRAKGWTVKMDEDRPDMTYLRFEWPTEKGPRP